jgi:hypothetical protein
VLHMLQAVAALAQGLGGSADAVMWCRERAARTAHRASALVPALQELLEASVLEASTEARVEFELMELEFLRKYLMRLGQVGPGVCCCWIVCPPYQVSHTFLMMPAPAVSCPLQRAGGAGEEVCT